MAGAAVCLIAGIFLYKAAPVFIFITAAILLTAILLIRIKFNKMHIAYIIFPVLMIIGYLDAAYQQNLYKETPSGKACVEGMIYNVKESSYGYQLFIRKNIFDKKRYVVLTDTYYPNGSRIIAKGNFSEFSIPTNPGEFDSRTYYNSLKICCRIKADEIIVKNEHYNLIYYYASRASDKINSTYNKICDEKYASVFGAMLLGKKDELDSELRDLLSSGGIGHILAISGLHISMIGMAVYKLLRKADMNYLISMIVSSLFIFFYGIMTGNGVSTIRALIMFSVYVYANVAEKTYDMISAASLAALISLIDSPMLIYNCSFLLSYMAVVGIVYVYGALSKSINCKNKIINGFAASLSIQICTLPVTLYFFYQVPVLSVFLNIIVIPLMSIVMFSAVSGGIAGLVFTGPGMIFIGPAVYIIKFYEWLCKLNEKIPWSVYTAGRPSIFRIFIYYLLVFLIVYLVTEKKKNKINLGIAACVLFLMVKIRTGFTAVFLDVGQGDCIFMQNKDGTTFLVDCGSSDKKMLYEYTLKPFLLSQGCDRLDYVIVTHCDSDHISGLKELFINNDIKVSNLVMPDTTLIDSDYENLVSIAESAGSSVSRIYEGMNLKRKDMSVCCLHPEPDYITSEKNDYSTTLLVRYKDYGILLTGDISGDVERHILDKNIPYKDINILKAAHHGSRNSNTEDFISYFNPDEVIISCGKDNSYGHPHEETLERFSKYGVRVRRTDELGAIIIHVD